MHCFIFNTYFFAVICLLNEYSKSGSSTTFDGPMVAAFKVVDARFLQIFLTIDGALWKNQQIKVLGVLVAPENKWMLKFQLLRPLENRSIPFTSPFLDQISTNNYLPIPINECPLNRNSLQPLNLEVELSMSSMIVRGQNSMRYTFQTTLSPSQELELFFGLISSDRYGKTRFCRLPSEIVQKEASKYHIPPTTSTIIQTKSSIGRRKNSENASYQRRRQQTFPRRSTARSLISTRRSLSTDTPLPLLLEPMLTSNSKNVKALSNSAVLTQNTENSANGPIDILKDKKIYAEVQRSRTREVNSDWSWPFYLFFTLQSGLVFAMAFFALIVFALLQLKPKSKPVK